MEQQKTAKKAKAAKAPKRSWFAGLKSEFGKIEWADRKTVVRQTIAVIIISVVLAILIAIIDWLVQYGVNFLVGL